MRQTVGGGSDVFGDIFGNNSMVGIYEDGKNSPEVNRINHSNHFLPESIKGVQQP